MKITILANNVFPLQFQVEENPITSLYALNSSKNKLKVYCMGT